jgi:hypothetical protein
VAQRVYPLLPYDPKNPNSATPIKLLKYFIILLSGNMYKMYMGLHLSLSFPKDTSCVGANIPNSFKKLQILKFSIPKG